MQILEVDPVKRRISLGLKQTLQNPWEAFAEKHPVGSDGRGRGQEQDRVRPVHRPRRRRRRHGPPLRPRLEPSGRAGHRGVQEGRHGAGPGARRRRREGAHLARHQAAGGDPFADAGEIKKGQVVTCEVLEVKDGGIEVKIVDTDLTDLHQAQPSSPATAATSAPSASPPARRSMPASPSSTARRAGSPSRSRRSRWPRRRKRSRSTARPIRALRSATSSARPCKKAKTDKK